MKAKWFVSLVFGLLALSTHIAHAQSEEIGVNIQLQQDQIASDAKTGMMTMADAHAAMEYLNRIKFEYKRALSDGHINNYERQVLNEMLVINTNSIYRYRQNKPK